MGSAPGASQEFRFREGKLSAKTIEIFLENLHKILKISKIFQKSLVKFKQIKKKFEKLEKFLLICKFFSDNVKHFE